MEHQTYNPSHAKGAFNTRVYRKVMLFLFLQDPSEVPW